MTRLLSTTLAACTALAVSLASIGAIVSIPPAQAAASATIARPELA